MTEKNDKLNTYLLGAVILLFVLGRVIGYLIFENNWSFNHWQFLPLWYELTWIILLAVAGLLFIMNAERIGNFFNTRLKIGLGLVVLVILTFVFQYDSFVYGSGNLRIAQIGQVPKIIYPWYEYGSIHLVSVFNSFYNLFELGEFRIAQISQAADLAWRTFSYLATFTAIIGMVKIVTELTKDISLRFYFFLILFFGGQVLITPGFIGVEPVVVAFFTWFGYFALKTIQAHNAISLLWLWVVTILGIFFHISLVMLVPVLIFVTLVFIMKDRGSILIPTAIAIVLLAAIVAIIYVRAGGSFIYSQYLLFPNGHRPHVDYGLFSGRHIGDYLQLLFMTIPLLLVIKFSSFKLEAWGMKNPLTVMAGLMTLGGGIIIFILNPLESIVMALPRLTAFLTPAAFLFVFVLHQQFSENKISRKWLAAFTVAAVMFPLAYFPSYISINKAQDYVNAYLEKNPDYYYTDILAFRDAYFYRRELERADRWEWRLKMKSMDYMNYDGCVNLVNQGRADEALSVLYQIVAKNPYWDIPRALVASLQSKAGRYELAKPQIDTILMLKPQNKEYLQLRYNYLRDTGEFAKALQVAEDLKKLYPDDLEIETDYMIIQYRLNNVKVADSLASNMIENHPEKPYAYLVKGFLLEQSRRPFEALSFYEKFVELAPDETETPMVKNKIEAIKKLREKP